MTQDTSPLSAEERAELEALRAAKLRNDEAAQARAQRQELENLRKAQKYAEEDAKYYAERERRKEERARAREHPDYSLDDLEPMPLKQKIVIAVIIVMVILLIVYVARFNMGA